MNKLDFDLETKEEYHIEQIICPECGVMENAKVEHTEPWFTYIHSCTMCGYLIMESEWNTYKP